MIRPRILTNTDEGVSVPPMTTDRRPRVLLNRVRERRKALRWTQQALADRVGVSRQTINKIENQPGYDIAKALCVRLATALDAEESWLFYEGIAA